MKSEDSINPMQETSPYMRKLIEKKHLPVSIKKLEKPGRKNSLQLFQDEVQGLNFKLSKYKTATCKFFLPLSRSRLSEHLSSEAGVIYSLFTRWKVLIFHSFLG